MLEDFGGSFGACSFWLWKVELKSLGRRLRQVVGIVGNLLADYRGDSNWNLQNWGPSDFICFFKQTSWEAQKPWDLDFPWHRRTSKNHLWLFQVGYWCRAVAETPMEWCTLRVTVTGFFWGLFGKTWHEYVLPGNLSDRIHLWYLVHLRFQQQHRSAFLSLSRWTWLFCTTCVPIWDAGVRPSGRGSRNETILEIVWREKWKDELCISTPSRQSLDFCTVCICSVLEAVDRWNATVRNCRNYSLLYLSWHFLNLFSLLQSLCHGLRCQQRCQPVP